jgi:hypothetical protein
MTHQITRRSMMTASALGLGALALAGPHPLEAAGEKPKPQTARFNHRGYLGWITDLATNPDPSAAWPSMRLDAQLLKDYQESFAAMRRLGFNEISVWGLYVSRAWPADIASSVTSERGALVERLIEAAHRNGVRVYSGLGVYSWGFDEIIRSHPKLSRGNASAMCASEAESWRWMQKVLDFVFQRFEIDGVSLQSADQGRCRCDQCKSFTDAEYHALLNVRVSEYIRSRWPKKTIGVNSWGMKFEEPETLASLKKISEKVDYLIDVHDTSRKKDLGYRKKIIDSLSCDFGTLGGPQVEPPQHWERDRWFLPTLKNVAAHLQELSAEGGRACEYFYHILANPADELSFWLAGKVLSDPARSWEKHLEDSVEELYQVRKKELRDELARIFLDAEQAYFRHLPARMSGTISMEPLVSDKPGPPIYLTKRLSPEQRSVYASELAGIKSRAAKLAPEMPQHSKSKMERVIRCLSNAMKDAGSI